jgi:hypothetical protein
MEYFKTSLSADQVTALLSEYSTDPKTDYCVVEIEKKKSLVITDDDSICTILMKEDFFKPVYISELDLLSLPVIYKVVLSIGQ